MPDMTTSDLNNMMQRLDQLESKDAIRALCTSYAVACDEHDMPRLMSLFTADACFTAPNGSMVAQGRDAIETMFIETFKTRGPAFHWTHDIVVTIDDASPDKATGLVLSHAETSPNGTVSLAAMRYRDNYERQNGRWQFARREISFLYYVPATEYASGLNNADRVFMGDRRMPADYPESLPHWQAFIAEHGPLQQG